MSKPDLIILESKNSTTLWTVKRPPSFALAKKIIVRNVSFQCVTNETYVLSCRTTGNTPLAIVSNGVNLCPQIQVSVNDSSTEQNKWTFELTTTDKKPQYVSTTCKVILILEGVF